MRNLSTVAKFAIVQPEGTVKEYLTVQTEGNRNVIRKVKYYKNRQVKRNIERFPEDFMFQLTKEEYNSLRCHFGTSNRRGGDRRAKHNAQYPEIEFIQIPHKNHDRFLTVDNEVYLLGASVKDMGIGLCAITKMTISPEKLLSYMN